MKKIILIMMFALSLGAMASEQNMSMEKSANMFPWQTSSTVCAASTRCPNGMIAACKVFGFQYRTMPGGYYNSCTWRVIPGRFVQCQGYQQVYNPLYRMYMWQWVNIPVRCF